MTENTAISPTLALAMDLINKKSVTPEDAGCQQLMIDRLTAIGFQVEKLRFGDVENFWAWRGDSGPWLCFAGHTDVVPTGDPSAWESPPFEAKIEHGMLLGRGAADMKGSLAAMITAAENFVAGNPDHTGRIAFLITSDEEGIAVDGTVRVVEWLQHQDIRPDWCVVGEPSSTSTTGDVIKNGRRGSLGGELIIKGVQGHVAYPHLADNPIHKGVAALAELAGEHWDDGNEFFPATSFQMSNINAGTGATNVIPGEMQVIFNFRYSTEVTDTQLRDKVHRILDRHKLNYDLNWTLSGLPFLTEPGDLVNAVRDTIYAEAGINTELSTAGGTSDGRFIAPLGTQVVEVGPVNSTIHKVNERVNAEELNTLSRIYQGVMQRLLT